VFEVSAQLVGYEADLRPELTQAKRLGADDDEPIVGGTMHKKIVVVLSLCVGIAFVGCKKDAEINTAMTDISAFTAELVQKVEATQGSIEGIEAAQQFLDSRREEIKNKLGILKEARGFQVSDATKKSLTDSVTRNMTSVASLQIKFVTSSLKDANYKSKLEKLVKDYTALLTS
jgi:hypothetical protein